MNRVAFICLFASLTFLNCASVRSEDAESIRAAARSAIEADSMGNQLLPHAQGGSKSTWIGTVVDESCFKSIPESRSEARLEKLEAALALALARLRTCGSTLGLVETRDTISVLRRTRIFCKPSGGMAEMTMILPYEKVPGGRISARATHQYEMLLAVPSFKVPEETQAQQPSFERWSDEDLAAVMSHEAMHVLAMNNRDWHDTLRGRAKFGCRDSTYEDRIYFTEAACFPRSRGGVVYYANRSAWECPEVCEKALRGIDPIVAERLKPLPYSAPSTERGIYGPPLVAHPYAEQEAQRICEKVRQLRGSFP
jgi:hypothetical protein